MAAIEDKDSSSLSPKYNPNGNSRVIKSSSLFHSFVKQIQYVIEFFPLNVSHAFSQWLLIDLSATDSLSLSVFLLCHNQSNFSNQNVVMSLCSSEQKDPTSGLESELLGSPTSRRPHVGVPRTKPGRSHTAGSWLSAEHVTATPVSLTCHYECALRFCEIFLQSKHHFSLVRMHFSLPLHEGRY